LNVELVNWISGAVLVLDSRAPWPRKNPVQQAEPNAALVTSKLLPFVATKRGPDSVSVVRLAPESERLRVKNPPDVFRLVLSKEKRGALPVLVTVALSPTNTNEYVLLVGSPFLRVVFTAFSSGPERPTDGERPRLEANEMKFPPAPGATAVPAVAKPPLIDIRGLVPALVREAPLNTPRISSPLVIVEPVALSSGP
jgi:hypothetical protein